MLAARVGMVAASALVFAFVAAVLLFAAYVAIVRLATRRAKCRETDEHVAS